MRVLVVDDEPAARARLRRMLAAFPDVAVVGEAPDARLALQGCVELAPDALFLDIQMPGLSGLDLASSLPDPAPAVVFVTAHDRYALEAFDAAAVDYLLKPVEPERLCRSVERLRAREGGGGRLPPAKLLIPDRGQMRVVAVADILWLEAADNYVLVHTRSGSALMRRTLAMLLADLGAGFVRTHRSAAVAIAHVAGLRSRGRGDATVELRGGASAPCSRQHRERLLQQLGQPAPDAPR